MFWFFPTLNWYRAKVLAIDPSARLITTSFYGFKWIIFKDNRNNYGLQTSMHKSARRAWQEAYRIQRDS